MMMWIPCSFDLLLPVGALLLRRHGRWVARIHLGPDVRQGLAALGQAIEAALAHLGRRASVQERTR
jgi:hypothetical protein